MIIACPACTTRYAVPDSAIGVEGRTVRCAKCKHSWYQDGTIPQQPAPARPVAAPTDTAPRPEPVAASAPTAPAPAPATRPAPTLQAAGAQPAADPLGAVSQAPTQARPPEPAPAPRPVPRPAVQTPAQPTPRTFTQPDATDPAAMPPASLRKPPAAVYDDTKNTVHYADERTSSFDFAPPFRPRRNWARIGTYAAAVFAVATLGLTGAIAWGGLPDWVPLPHETFRQGEPDLQLDFPRKRQDRQHLADGSDFFSVSGTISNIGSETRYVPSLLVVLRDARERIIYEKEIVPSSRKLAAGEVVTINEALTDIPKAATTAEIGWKPD